MPDHRRDTAPDSSPTTLERLTALARTHEEKLRFLVVGGVNTIAGYGLFAAMYFILGAAGVPGAWHYNAALVCAWIVSVCVSYTNFKLFVFRTRGTSWLAELGRSYVVYTGTLLVNLAVLNVLVQWAHLHPLVAQFASIFIVTMMSYLGHKYFTFGGAHSVEEEAEEPFEEHGNDTDASPAEGPDTEA